MSCGGVRGGWSPNMTSKNFRRSTCLRMTTRQTVSGVENILTADDVNHRRMRRLQNAAFSDKALKAQESVIAGYVSLLIHQLHKQASSPDSATVDMVAWYSFFTFDVM